MHFDSSDTRQGAIVYFKLIISLGMQKRPRSLPQVQERDLLKFNVFSQHLSG